MTQLKLLREEMVRLLLAAEIQAGADFPAQERRRYTEPVVVVSLKNLEAEGLGFQNYLGDRYDLETQAWEERYGQKTAVSFGLEVFSPRDCGAKGCQEQMDRVTEALGTRTPAGLAPRELNWGKLSYDKSCDMFRQAGEARYEGILYAVTDEKGSFLSFEVRGGITLE